MTRSVRSLFERCTSAYDVWKAARKTFTVTQNSSRLFQLRRQSVTTTQDGESVAMFYEKLHVIWEEIDNLRPNPHTNPKDVALRQKEIESERVYDFLGGLDPQFDGVRSRILAMTPVPSVLEAYALVVEESTRQVTMLGGAAALKIGTSQHRTNGASSTGGGGRQSSLVNTRSRGSSNSKSAVSRPPAAKA
ncbi:hypothetical protein PS1_033663 [Malus domestica]